MIRDLGYQHATGFAFRNGFVVSVTFEDGSRRDIDLKPYLRGPIFEPIRKSPARFRELFLDSGVLSWPNGADIAPETIYLNLPPPPMPAR
jgi:hypothetical protein